MEDLVSAESYVERWAREHGRNIPTPNDADLGIPVPVENVQETLDDPAEDDAEESVKDEKKVEQTKEVKKNAIGKTGRRKG